MVTGEEIERIVQALGKIYSIPFDRTSKITLLENIFALLQEKKISKKSIYLD